MTEAELATVEAQLGVTLPDHYRCFLLDYPQSLSCRDFPGEKPSHPNSW